MTLVELTLTMVVLAVAVGGTLSSISSFVLLSDSSWERSIAYTAAQTMLEEMQAQEFNEVFARYNDDASDDPAGVIPGADFDVAGLDAQQADADGIVGRVEFPTKPGEPTALYENLVDDSFGFPRDLNADGDVDVADIDRSDDYDLLPVRVVIEWRGRSGNRRVELETVLRNNS